MGVRGQLRGWNGVHSTSRVQLRATWRESNGSGLEMRKYGHRDPSHWPRAFSFTAVFLRHSIKRHGKINVNGKLIEVLEIVVVLSEVDVTAAHSCSQKCWSVLSWFLVHPKCLFQSQSFRMPFVKVLEKGENSHLFYEVVWKLMCIKTVCCCCCCCCSGTMDMKLQSFG
jgi:hypothetical protein